ncbi:3-methylornithyl-N6-L-lysine dehydrogenase PylD [Candidatus Methanomassiliicoccus intestinalis]|mgnify:CR=1 FL=1|uniref:3-methylornithyl-N6-L-lysine dehydrogenase PylD n=1 Tax=Candidatus Methanomassiliicoccus intestinalis TaxID=1406512 RepID=UPI0037DBFB53
MTRLTPEMIKNVPYTTRDRDSDLLNAIGIDMKGLAYEALGIRADELSMEDYSVAVVPVTSGKGVTSGFTESVCSIIQHLGMKPFLTQRTDIAGLADALSAKADLVFMADDDEFIALNVHTGTFSNNIRSTALGYFTALKIAAQGLRGKEVLLIGAGRVGDKMADLLEAEEAVVTIADIDLAQAKAVQQKHADFKVSASVEEAVRNAKLILNASPGKIPGEWLQEGVIVSSPGMPYSFDEEGLRKMKTLIHDPLQIGVSVMAVWSASLSLYELPLPVENPVCLEVVL